MRPILLGLLAALTLPALASDVEQAALSVWARALFGKDGKAAEYAIVDEERYPAKLAANVKARLAHAKIDPPLVNGEPATLRTAIEFRFEISSTSQGPVVKAVGMAMSPLMLKSEPDAPLRVVGWKGEVTATCQVGVEGKCLSVAVAAPNDTPENVRRYARFSLERARFEPQEIDGKPIQGEYRHTITIDSDAGPNEDFREDKFLRALKGK
jgi:hypothetical protein